MLDKVKRWQIVLQDYTFARLLNNYDDDALKASLFHNNCLNHLSQIKQQIHFMYLRYNFELPVQGAPLSVG